MLRTIALGTLVTVCSIGAIVACSSSSSSGSSSSGGPQGGSGGGSGSGSGGGSEAVPLACFEALVGSEGDCVQCESNACRSQISALQDPCSDFLSCYCPGGLASGSATACAAKGQEPACQSALQAVAACGASTCAQACTDGGSNPMPIGTCATLYQCCMSLGCYDGGGCEKQGCLTVVENNPNDQQLCQTDLMTFCPDGVGDGG
jgi:hypothetical protein